MKTDGCSFLVECRCSEENLLNNMNGHFKKGNKKGVLTYVGVYGIPLWMLAFDKFRQSFKICDGADELRHNVHYLCELCERWGELDLSKQRDTSTRTAVKTICKKCVWVTAIKQVCTSDGMVWKCFHRIVNCRQHLCYRVHQTFYKKRLVTLVFVIRYLKLDFTKTNPGS